MEEKARYVVGIDIGTNMVRAVQGRVGSDGVISVVGYGETPSEGLRRGIIKELNSPAKAIDMSLKAVESMSGQFIDAAMANINGSHIGSTKVEGMIAIGVADHEINEEDLNRINSTATAGKVPSNRETLSLVPYEYLLDGQGGIREPLGMQGARLELRANVVSALAPDCDNVRKACEQINVRVDYLEPGEILAFIVEPIKNSKDIDRRDGRHYYHDAVGDSGAIYPCLKSNSAIVKEARDYLKSGKDPYLRKAAVELLFRQRGITIDIDGGKEDGHYASPLGTICLFTTQQSAMHHAAIGGCRLRRRASVLHSPIMEGE